MDIQIIQRNNNWEVVWFNLDENTMERSAHFHVSQTASDAAIFVESILL